MRLRLHPDHATELFIDSQIAEEVVANRGYRSVTAQEAAALGFARYQSRDGLLIPQWTLAGVQRNNLLKPDNPRVDEKGKAIKYEVPADSVPHFDIHPDARYLLKDPSIPVYFTEGTKKSDAAWSHGLLCISLPGVWQFLNGKVVVPDLDEILLLDRTARIAYDSDVTRKPEVAEALLRFWRALERRGALVEAVYFPEGPDGAKVGFDDYFVAGGTVDGLEALVSASPPGTPAPGSRDQAERQVRFITAREFAQQTPEDVAWVLEPFIPVGGLTKIDGKPKAAGKTTLITHMVAATLTGADFLGKPTKQGPVVLLTEQGGTSFRGALDRAGLLDRDDLFLATYRDLVSLSWPEVVEDAFAKAVEVGAVLLVVDTLPACARVRGDEENSSGKAREVLEPLQVGADAHGIGVVLSFHDRKGGGEVGESGRGSSAYAGGVDVNLQITKPGGNLSPAVRKIEALSRFEATPDELYVELTEAGYVSLGSEEDVVTAAITQALPKVLPTTEEEAKPMNSRADDDGVLEGGILDELKDAGVKAARSTVDAELKRWAEGGYVGQNGSGKRGSPYRYWLIDKPPDAFLRSNAPRPSEERIWCLPSRVPKPSVPRDVSGPFLSSDGAGASEETTHVDDRSLEREPLLSSDAEGPYIGSNDGHEAPRAGNGDASRHDVVPSEAHARGNLLSAEAPDDRPIEEILKEINVPWA